MLHQVQLHYRAQKYPSLHGRICVQNRQVPHIEHPENVTKLGPL